MTADLHGSELADARALAARVDAGLLSALESDPPELAGMLRTYERLGTLSRELDPAFARYLRRMLGGRQQRQPAATPRRRWRPRWGAVLALGGALAALLLFLFVLVNSGSGGLGGAPESASLVGGAPQSPAANRGALPALQTQQRMLVQRVTMQLLVRDPAASLEQVKAIVSARGGFIVELQMRQDAQAQGRTSLSLRVPSESLEQALAELRGLGSVDYEALSSEDQTAAYVDLDARLRNLQLTEQELQELLTSGEQRQGQAEEILAVYQHVSSVREQIEQLQAQKRLLEESVALAEIDLTLIPEGQAPGFSAGQTLRGAWLQLVIVLQWLATLLLWALVFVPLLLLLGVLLLLARRGLRRLRRARAGAADALDEL